MAKEPKPLRPDPVEERITKHFQEQGISARGGIRESDRLAHEGGKRSKEGQELEALIALDEKRRQEAQEHPPEPEPEVCLYCVDGTDWRGGSPEACAKCLGTGKVVLSEEEKIRNGLEVVSSMRDRPEDVTLPVDVLVKEFEDVTQGPKAPPGVRSEHLLPHEGGKRSREGRELERQMALYEERKAQYGKDYWYYAKVNGW